MTDIKSQIIAKLDNTIAYLKETREDFYKSEYGSAECKAKFKKYNRTYIYVRNVLNFLYLSEVFNYVNFSEYHETLFKITMNESDNDYELLKVEQSKGDMVC